MPSDNVERITMDLAVNVAQESKTVRVWSFGDSRWHLDANDNRHAGVIFRFPSGGKLHLLKSPQVFIRGGCGSVVSDVIHNRRAVAVRWAKPDDIISKWSH